MSDKMWNGKLIGLPSAAILVAAIILEKLSDRIMTFLFVTNIKKCGKGVKMMKGCLYRYPKFIEAEDEVIIGKETAFTSEGLRSHYLVLEEGVSIGMKCSVDFSGGIIVRKHAHIAHNVLISTHEHGYDYRNPPIGRALEIGENAFIGSSSIIMHNCNYIGKCAVVGTGSVVTKDVPDYAIVAGNPARVIKYIINGEKS